VVGSAAQPCTQLYVAEIGDALGGGGQLLVPFPNDFSDANDPHVWNGTAGMNGSQGCPDCPVQSPGAYIWFDTSFHGSGTGVSAPVNWDLCGSSGDFPLVLMSTARIPVVVHVPYQGHDVSSSGFLNWFGNPNGGWFGGPGGLSMDTATYSVPGGWNWTLAPVGPATSAISPVAPLPSLVAFVRSAC
jgi:hypothetical protein